MREPDRWDATGTAGGNGPAVPAPLLPVNAAVSADSAMESQSALAGDGKASLIPASLVEPLVRALPEPKDTADALDDRDDKGR